MSLSIHGISHEDSYQKILNAFEGLIGSNETITAVYVIPKESEIFKNLDPQGRIEVKILDLSNLQGKPEKLNRIIQGNRLIGGTESKIFAHENIAKNMRENVTVALRNTDQHPEQQKEKQAKVESITEEDYLRFIKEVALALSIPLDIMGESKIAAASKRRDKVEGLTERVSERPSRARERSTGVVKKPKAKGPHQKINLEHATEKAAAEKRSREESSKKRKETERKKEEKSLKAYEDRREHHIAETKKSEKAKTKTKHVKQKTETVKETKATKKKKDTE